MLNERGADIQGGFAWCHVALGTQDMKCLPHSLQKCERVPSMSQVGRAEPTQEENEEVLLGLPRIRGGSVPENPQLGIG